jgi:hypothetical protein
MDLATYLLFEDPLTLWIILGAIGILAGVAWSRTGSRRSLALAAGCVAAGVVIGILAQVVETGREKVEHTLTVMAAAARDGDAERLIDQISADYHSGTSTRESLAEAVRTGLALVRADAAPPSITMEDGEATVVQTYRFAAAPRSPLHLLPGSSEVTWKGTFAPDADGRWRLRSVTTLRPQQVSPEEALQMLRAASGRGMLGG